jgi:hypothetical protein
MLVHQFIRVEKNIETTSALNSTVAFECYNFDKLYGGKKKKEEMFNVWKQFFFRRNKEKKKGLKYLKSRLDK